MEQLDLSLRLLVGDNESGMQVGLLLSGSFFLFICLIGFQVATAALTHKWFLKTFVDYPKQRKILIPCLW